MNVYDTTKEMLSSYENNQFDLSKWEEYMDSFVPGAKKFCLKDMHECFESGYSWEKDFVPVLNAVVGDPDICNEIVTSFHRVANNLEEKIIKRFGKSIDADIFLYLGLCNGAGWVTEINGRTTILLGVEKILELHWQDIDFMNALIIHELGHVYHTQYGISHRNIEFRTNQDQFLWQLFREGVAMVFEHEILDDPEYYHQDNSGWKDWCDDHFEYIRESFSKDMEVMNRDNQRYFGDWVDFEGYSDVGYYLGTRFIQYLLRLDSFDNIIRYNIETVREKYKGFCSV